MIVLNRLAFLIRQFSPALIVALLAIALLAWQWLETRHRLSAQEASLSERLTTLTNQAQENRNLVKKTEEATNQANARIAVLEQKLADSQSQQEALQTLYQEFVNNREQRIVSEVEQLLIIASEQLQLAGNQKTALLAIQTADMRLSQIDKPQAVQLRRLLAKDIAHLQALPAVDVVGASLRLETLEGNIATLPLLSDHHPHPDALPQSNPPSSLWKKLASQVWQDIHQLVRIERIDHPQAPLLTPEQSFFLRENLRLRLLSAKVSLLQRDQSTYQSDVRAAKIWLKQYFDSSDAAVKAATATLHELGDADLTMQLPEINASLNEASRYKLLLEKSGK